MQRFVRTNRFEVESGLDISENTGRIIQVGAGVIWYGAEYLSLEQTLSTDTCYQWYHITGGSWTKSLITQYNNSQYDTGTALATLTNNRYAVNWIFREVSTNKTLHIVLGRGNYQQTDAINSTIPPLPPLITSECVLVGKIVVVYLGSIAYSISSAFTPTFAGGSTIGADNIAVIDSGNYFTGTNVETILQEIGLRLANHGI